MAVINSTQVVVKRTVASTDCSGTEGQTSGRTAAYDVPKETIRYELIKENMGDNPAMLYEYEMMNVGEVHSQNT